MSSHASSSPAVVQGWQATWSDQYNQWFYVNEKTGTSQWEHPSIPTYTHQSTTAPQPTYPYQNQSYHPQQGFTSPPATIQSEAPTDRGIMSKLSNLDPKAQTALAVGSSLAAGAFLEHEYDERHHHTEEHHLLGSMTNFISATGAVALGAKFFGRKGQAAQPQHHAAAPMPYQSAPQHGYQSGPPGGTGHSYSGPPPTYPAQYPPPLGPAGHSSGLGSLAAGGGAGVAGALATDSVSNLLQHHHSQGQNSVPDTTASSGSTSVGPATFLNNLTQTQTFSSPRLHIHAAAFADADVTDRVRSLISSAQELTIAKLSDEFGDPWPEAKRKSFSVLYQYGERPMEVWCGSGENASVDIRNEALSNARMAFVNKDSERIICLIWGQISVMSKERAEKLEKEGELDCKDLGDGGFYPWEIRNLICYYRTENGSVGIGHGREGGTMRLPWNALAKWS